MTDKDAEQAGEQEHPQAPWWAGLGTRGAVALIVLGGAAAAWTFIAPAAGLTWLPLTPEIPASGYYQAAKIAAIGLVILGTALLGRRGRAGGAEETRELQKD